LVNVDGPELMIQKKEIAAVAKIKTTIIIDSHLLAISLCTTKHRKIMQGIRNAVFVHQNGF
jgi:hypothetical protein